MKKFAALLVCMLIPCIACARTHIGLQSPLSIPPSVSEPIGISLNFTDEAPDFSGASLSLTNASVSGFAVQDDRNFSFTLTPVADGTFGFDIPEGTVGDNNVDFSFESTYVSPSQPQGDDATSTEDEATSTPDDTPVPVSGGGGGGGGSGSAGGAVPQNTLVPASAPAPAPAPEPQAPQGEVLGVQTFRFTTYLARGMDGQDVTNLQTVLTGLGFLAAGHVIGHFGPLTQAAAAAYQKAHGLTQTGAVGPKTRAALNGEDLDALLSSPALQ